MPLNRMTLRASSPGDRLPTRGGGGAAMALLQVAVCLFWKRAHVLRWILEPRSRSGDARSRRVARHPGTQRQPESSGRRSSRSTTVCLSVFRGIRKVSVIGTSVLFLAPHVASSESEERFPWADAANSLDAQETRTRRLGWCAHARTTATARGTTIPFVPDVPRAQVYGRGCRPVLPGREYAAFTFRRYQGGCGEKATILSASPVARSRAIHRLRRRLRERVPQSGCRERPRIAFP